MPAQPDWFVQTDGSGIIIPSTEEQETRFWTQPTSLPENTPIPTFLPPSTPALSTQSRRSRASEGLTSPGKHLTAEEKLLVLRIAIQFGNAYGHGTYKTFWARVAKELEKTTGRQHKTIQRLVDKLVKDRRIALETEGSGENDNESSYAIAIDEWIGIIDNYKANTKAKKDEIDKDAEDADIWRADQMRFWTDRQDIGQIAWKRKANEQAIIDNNDDDDDDDYEEDQDKNNRSSIVDDEVMSPNTASMPIQRSSRSISRGRGSSRHSSRSRKAKKSEGRFETALIRLVEVVEAREARHTDNSTSNEVAALKAEFSEVKSDIKGLRQEISMMIQVFQANTVRGFIA